jgi:segregation and condensation protein B
MSRSSLASTIEALLFVETKPLSIKRLARVCAAEPDVVMSAVQELVDAYADQAGGLTIVVTDTQVQLTTAPDQAAIIAETLEAERSTALTRPSLETLTIIAYRGPVAKSEIELIRGVNCSLILRNLLIRGLIEQRGVTEIGTPVYQVTVDFLRSLGIASVDQLPEYEALNSHVQLQELLEQREPGDFFVTQHATQ